MAKAIAFCSDCGRRIYHAKPGADRSYCIRCHSRRPPTQEEIAMRCAEIQAGWTEAERERRTACDIGRRLCSGWTTPTARNEIKIANDHD